MSTSNPTSTSAVPTTILNCSENDFESNVVPSPPHGYEYRHCQEQCFQQIMGKIKKGKTKVAIQIPCGAGKTLLTWMFATKLVNKGIAILFVPRKDIATQTSLRMKPWGVNAAVFDGDNKPENLDNLKMVVCVSNSAATLYKLIANQRIDCVFTDEAHINNEGTFRDKIELFCTNCVHIQMSATLPSTITPDYTYTVRDAIDAKIIAQAVLNPIGVTSGNRHEIVVKHIVRYRERLGKMMVVNSTIIGAREMEQKLRDVELNVTYIDGDTKTVARNKILNNSDWDCLVVVNCCTVGTDIPSLKSVVFVDIRYSKMQIIQTAMRCMRYQPDKTATIVFPVITDDKSSSSSSLEVTTATEMCKTLLMMDTNQFDRSRTVVPLPLSISCNGLKKEDEEMARLLFNLMIENTEPQVEPEYWGLFEKYIHDILDKKGEPLSEPNKEKIFKHSRVLFNGSAKVKGNKLMDGLKITLHQNLAEIHAIAGDFRNLHGDPGNGYTLTHPLSKLNQFKLYLQTELNILFKNQHSPIVNHNKQTCLVHKRYKKLLQSAKRISYQRDHKTFKKLHIVDDAKKIQQLADDRKEISEIPDNLNDQINETKNKCECRRCKLGYLGRAIVKIANNAVEIVNDHKKRKRDDHPLEDNKKQKFKEEVSKVTPPLKTPSTETPPPKSPLPEQTSSDASKKEEKIEVEAPLQTTNEDNERKNEGDGNNNNDNKTTTDSHGNIIPVFATEQQKKEYRKGQNKMREDLIETFGTCPASNCSEADMVDAAHIIPYSECKHCFAYNGLLLHTAVHRAMDRGYITYDGNGQLWRVITITNKWLHDYASIRYSKLPDKWLTVKRKESLQIGYNMWKRKWGINKEDLCKVEIKSSK